MNLTLTLNWAEAVFLRAALIEQYNLYCSEWRKAFIKHNASVANVYLPAIRANRVMFKQVDAFVRLGEGV